MAIDTAAKRLSILDFGEETTPGIPYPDGSFNQADRQHFLWLYSGILVGGAVIEEVLRTTGMLSAKHVRRSMHRSR